VQRTVVLNVVGLTPDLVGAATPNLAAFARAGAMKPMTAVLPAVTCTAQASMVTGTLPREHGCVADGWRESGSVARTSCRLGV
jgi:predicted AlkP superfamily pyrophosphatase or phosphodiesterase